MSLLHSIIIYSIKRRHALSQGGWSNPLRTVLRELLLLPLHHKSEGLRFQHYKGAWVAVTHALRLDLAHRTIWWGLWGLERGQELRGMSCLWDPGHKELLIVPASTMEANDSCVNPYRCHCHHRRIWSVRSPTFQIWLGGRVSLTSLL